MSIPNPESEDERILESDDLGDARSERPDWLMGAAEGAVLKPAKGSPEPGSVQPLRLRDKEAREERPQLRLVEESAVNGPEAPAENTSPSPPEAWKAASSSVPKLRQKPAVQAPEPETDSFTGFTQDGIGASKAASKDPSAEPRSAEAAAPAEPPAPVPLGGETPLWLIWLDHLRFLRHPVALVIGALVITGLVVAHLLAPKVQEGESVARIRQQPEAYEGRSVTVGGVAGESYAVGPNTAFNLYQGRDTIVVYSPLLRPRIHEKVRVTGTISVGYLDGVPRITLLDDAKH